jgi:phosphoribosylformylglycinamidine synthase
VVCSGYGLNCEVETAYAFELAGAQADIVHLNDLIDNPHLLDQYQILTIPGGFSFGDDTGSGYAYANRMKIHLWDALLTFTQRDTLMLGICNGFQILVNLGLLPGLMPGSREVALITNENGRYLDRWVDLSVSFSTSPWLQGISQLSLPIAHGEGRFVTDRSILQQLHQSGQIVLRYHTGPICAYQQLAANPNGSVDDIAGITDSSGRILGMMPHPERGMLAHQDPRWPYWSRQDQVAPDEQASGQGAALFANAVAYFG